jgi:hypothetical protein
LAQLFLAHVIVFDEENLLLIGAVNEPLEDEQNQEEMANSFQRK